MSLLKGAEKPDKQTLRRIDQAKERIRQDTATVKERYEFARGNHYVSVYKNALQVLPTQTVFTPTGQKGKPDYKSRTTRNLIFDVVTHEVSAATGRIPSYEVVPSSSDPERISAASLAEKVLLYGYEKWSIREAFVKLVYHAVVGDEGFIWPYFDNSKGLPIDENVSTGEICHKVYSKVEVAWQDGVRFEDARWLVIQQARPIEEVQQEYGVKGIKPDGSPTGKQGKKGDFCLEINYLERPSTQNPDGRWLTVVGERKLKETFYPCVDGEGKIVDEPVIHKLAYAVDADSDRDMGLVRHLIDAMRTYEDAINKLIEWKNLALIPQMMGPRNSMNGIVITEQPGAKFEYRGSTAPQWRPTPPVPRELFEIAQNAKEDLYKIAAQNEIPPQIEAGKAIVAYTERDEARRGDFLRNLADIYASVARSDLYLVQRHYSDQRLVKIKGHFGFESIPDFRGADLLNQTDVRVYPESIQPKTKAGIAQEAQNLLQVGAITPLQYKVQIKGGMGVSLADSYLYDLERANTVIQAIRKGLFLEMPQRPALPEEKMQQVPDPLTGQMVEQPIMEPVANPDGSPILDPATGQPAMKQIEMVPGWMPRPFDDLDVHEAVVSNWMKVAEFNALPLEGQEAAGLYYSALQDLKAKAAAKESQQQQAMAEGLGRANAASPEVNPAGNGNKPMPSLSTPES